MSQISYEMVQPLIAEANQQGSSMYVTFRCPVSGQSVEARGALQAANTVGSRVAASAKRSIMWSLRNALSRTIRQALGHGMAGRLAADAASGAMSGSGAGGPSYSEADRQAAIVRAFESVANMFTWDSQGNRFVAAKAADQVMTDFMQTLTAAPVTAAYDRGVLARMLTEVACADGSMGDDERAFLGGFVTPDVGTVESLAGMQPLSPVELGETTAGAGRETMLMLAWAVALTDEDLAPQEQARLNEYAADLGIAAARAEELKGYAQVYLVDQALGRAYPGGRRDSTAHGQVMVMAGRIGMSKEDAERVDIRYRKRLGIM